MKKTIKSGHKVIRCLTKYKDGWRKIQESGKEDIEVHDNGDVRMLDGTIKSKTGMIKS